MAKNSAKSGWTAEIGVRGFGIVERTRPIEGTTTPVTYLTVRGSKGYVGQIKALGDLAKKVQALKGGEVVLLEGRLEAWNGEPYILLRRVEVLSSPSLPEEEMALVVEGSFFLGPNDYRVTEKGNPFLQGVLRFGKDEGGKSKEIRFTLFGEEAEQVADHLTSKAWVRGYFVEESWTSKEGEKRYAAKLRATRLVPLRDEGKKAQSQPKEEVGEEEGEADFLDRFPEDLPF